MGRKSKEAFGRPSGGHIWTQVHLFLSTHNIWSGKKLSFSPCLLPQLCPKPTTTPQNFLIPRDTQSLQHQSMSLTLLQDCWIWHGFQQDILHTASQQDRGEISQDKGTLGEIAINPTATLSTHGIKPPQSLCTDAALPYPRLKHLKPHMDNTTFGIGVLVLDVSPGLVISGEPINSPIPRKDWIEPPVLIYPWLLRVLLKGQQPRNERWWDKALPEASPPLCD